MALVLGNETSGLNKETIEKLSKIISIPLANNIESLNVAASAAIASYEIVPTIISYLVSNGTSIRYLWECLLSQCLVSVADLEFCLLLQSSFLA